MNNNFFKLKVSLLLLIMLLTLITITYGAFYGANKQVGNISLSSSCFSVSFTDGESINMSGALPLSDEEGMYQKPYEFSLINNCQYDMSFKVVANVLSTSIDNSNIKFMFDSAYIGLISEEESLDEIEGFQTPKVLGTGVVKAGTKNTKKLRFWLDESTPLDKVKNKSWNAQIKIISGVSKAK